MASETLTARQRRFVAEYLACGNATEAARRAGYSAKTAHAQGSRLLKNAEVRAALEKKTERLEEKLELSAERVLTELARIAFMDIGRAFGSDGRLLALHEMPEDVRRALASIETDEMKGQDAGLGITRKVKAWDKPKALELLGKHFKLFADKVEHSADKSLEDLVRASFAPAGGSAP